MIIGIDLGTTNSVAAYMGGNGPQLIPNAVGEYLTPSVIGIDVTGKVLIGRAALEYQVIEPNRCASHFKRYMGLDKKLELGGKVFTPEQLSSLVLKSLKHDAEAFFDMPIKEAVITVPAYFNDHQRKATIAAGQIAGFEVRRILNEPTAAALAYGLHDGAADRTLIILDLGGGTFDVSIVEVFDGTIEVKASSGECFLGGSDFTSALASFVLKRQGLVLEQEELRHPKMVSRLVQQCELAKRTLTNQENASIRVPNMQGEFAQDAAVIEVTRNDFNQATANILARIDMPMRRALADANLTRDSLNQVVLVGGATRMGSFVEHITKLFQRKPMASLNPDEVVAIGAAVQAALFAKDASVKDLVVTDVCPFTLGIEVSKMLGDQIVNEYYLPIINRNTVIPVSRVDRVCTVYPNQTHVDVTVYQGEGRLVKDNLKIGSFRVQDIPLGPAGQELDVRFTYDLNGILEVDATIVKTGKTFTHVIAQHAKDLSPREIKKAIEKMKEFKTHPRDEAVNQWVLKRAERIFGELPPNLRDELGRLIDAFEGAMNLQIRSAIDESREMLESALDHFENSNDSENTNNSPW